MAKKVKQPELFDIEIDTLINPSDKMEIVTIHQSGKTIFLSKNKLVEFLKYY